MVEWDKSGGGGVTVEPASILHPELVREYELKLSSIEKAHAASVKELTEMERMIEELIRKQNVKGEVKDWIEGVTEELETVRDIRFEEVDDETRQRVLDQGIGMRLRMILEHKKDNRMKGRLVGQGFWEDVGVTGENVDAPVASFAAVRVLLFMSGPEGEVIASGDISKAFLKADEYPEGSEPRYVVFSMYKGGPVKVWRLKGPLYGSRDSPKLWYESFRKFMTVVDQLQESGFELDKSSHDSVDISKAVQATITQFIQGENDPCCFRHPVTGLKVVLFVDDIMTRGMPDVTEQFYDQLNKKYALRTWSILSVDSPLKHLGFTITEECVDGELYRYMSQGDDVRRFVNDKGLDFVREVSSPMPDRDSVFKDETLLDDEEKAYFKSLNGSMSWFGISLRYDICHSVSRLQQFGENPTKSALDAAIRVAAYLSSTADFRIGGKVCYGETVVSYYTDSDHAGDRGFCTMSHTGIMLVMNGIPIHWRSKKQPKTVISPAHAEIYACSEGVKEARWVQWVASDLGLALQFPLVLQVDNKQVISFKYGTCAHSRMRGMIDCRENWVKELRDDNLVELVKVSSIQNWADILTKCLRGSEFKRQVRMIQGGNDFKGQLKVNGQSDSPVVALSSI